MVSIHTFFLTSSFYCCPFFHQSPVFPYVLWIPKCTFVFQTLQTYSCLTAFVLDITLPRNVLFFPRLPHCSPITSSTVIPLNILLLLCKLTRCPLACTTFSPNYSPINGYIIHLLKKNIHHVCLSTLESELNEDKSSLFCVSLLFFDTYY